MDEVKKFLKALIPYNKEELDKTKRQISKVSFRLTNKRIDFEDMYLKLNGLKPYESDEEKKALSSLNLIFNKRRGILSRRNIDISQDAFGRNVLVYGKDSLDISQSFGSKLDRVYDEKSSTDEFLKSNQVSAEERRKNREKNSELNTSKQKSLEDERDDI